ncbi:hypothetical protein ACFYWN_43445 [Streptomyces sp. NPDC002917]|uniref:hypothetical protein n=1 Tax=unclassified Streptomyces TaxID=2593676 RepID=UPI00369D43A8|nr:hypothetical protein OH719_26900 [Streptomyces sp. NBC_01653]WTD89706.1 hypothetical protein OG891_19970 [Streptomyces sp. NBC_01637]WTF25275.1 hypothetical protein OG955_02675 [Streptomyces sp. NBC_01602]
MSPEHRTPTPFGPLLRGKRKKIGGLASVALLVAIGLATPAAAIAHTMTANEGVTSVADDPKCDKYGMQALGKCRKPRPTPPTGCNDIDSVIHGVTKYVSAVCDGRVFVLAVAEEPETTPIEPGWVATGGPSDVIDATVAEHGNNVYVTVLTAGGQVHEGTCETGPGEPGPGNPITTCTFEELPTPPDE